MNDELIKAVIDDKLAENCNAIHIQNIYVYTWPAIPIPLNCNS